MKRCSIDWIEISKTKCRGIAAVDIWDKNTFVADPPTETKKLEVSLEMDNGNVLSLKPANGEKHLPNLDDKDKEFIQEMARAFMCGVRNEEHIFSWTEVE